MNLTALQSFAKKVSQGIGALVSSQYSVERDPETTALIITFIDGERHRLPVINPRPYQVTLRKKRFIENIKRFLVQRPRRSGKEVESWSIIIESAITTPGLYIMNYPTNVRARAVLWDGQITLEDGSSYKFLDMIPARLIDGKPDETEMKIYLVNGSIIWVMGSDTAPDKLRGTNPRGMVSAEFAFSDPRVFYIMLPVFRQNGGWWLGQSTYNSINHFYQMMDKNKSNPLWYCADDSIETLVDPQGNRYITDEMIQEDRDAGMPEWMIQQEYYGKIEINQEKNYFSVQVKHILENDQLVTNLYLPNRRIYTAWDIGINDLNCITIFQMTPKGSPAIIGYMETNNKTLEFELGQCHKFATSRGSYIHTHFFPHDGKNRQKTGAVETPKTLADIARDAGENVVIVKRPASKTAAIQQMRQMLVITQFNKELAKRLFECISSYEKEYDEKRKIYLDSHKHNWASHGVDSFQTMTIAIMDNLVNEMPRNVIYNPHMN